MRFQPHSSSSTSMYSFLITPVFSSPNRRGASIAITTGKRTPIGLDFTQNMATRHASWIDVNRLTIFVGTLSVHLSFGATEGSLKNPIVRSHISFPGSADVPRYRKSPISTDKGTFVNNSRGFRNNTQQAIIEWIVTPVTRCSIVPSNFPSESYFEEALT